MGGLSAYTYNLNFFLNFLSNIEILYYIRSVLIQ